MAHQQGPTAPVGRLVSVAQDLVAVESAALTAVRKLAQQPGQGPLGAGRHLIQALAAGSVDARRPASPRGQRVAEPSADLRVGEPFPFALGYLRQTRLGAEWGSGTACRGHGVGHVLGRAPGPAERGVNDCEGRRVGDGQGWVTVRVRQAAARETSLQFPGFAQGRLHLTLEALLNDELGFAVAQQDQDGVQAVRNERNGPGGPGLPGARPLSVPQREIQRSVAARMTHTSRTAGLFRIAVATASGTSSSTASSIRAS